MVQEKTGSLVQRLLRLAWPVALARLGIMGMGVVDVMVVGQLAPQQLAWQALGWTPINVLVVSGIGLLFGVQVLAAKALGAGAPHEAGGAWRRGLFVAAVAGVFASCAVWILGAHLFSAFGIGDELAQHSARVSGILALSVPTYLVYVTCSFFLEAVQRPFASTVAMWGTNAVNLVLNLLLVPRFGAEGSAWCTVGARLFLAVLMVVWILRLPEAERFGLRQRGRGPSWSALLGVGAATAVSNAAESGAFSGMTILAGRLGADAVASYQILLNLLAIVFMLSLGVSSATSVLTAEAVGRKVPADATRATFTGLAVNSGVMLVVALLVLTFAPSIGRAYTANLLLAGSVSALLWLASLIVLPDGGQVVAAAALRARGDNWFPTASHLLAYAAIMPALGYALAEAQRRGVAGLMLAILGASVVSFVVLCGRLIWLSSRAKAMP
ncbi:MAG TPA: MATE family efflux transporter [Polyangiaceae bacterium]|nr:MATE family efflux transporter [Polyangiaceae bacterium]